MNSEMITIGTPAPWQQQALSELSDMTRHLISGQYESPADLANDMNQRATAIAHVLATDATNALPQLLDGLGAHAMALQFAANEIAMHTQEPRDEIVARLHRAGWERYQASSPDELASILQTTLTSIGRYRNFSINTAGPAPEDDLTA